MVIGIIGGIGSGKSIVSDYIGDKYGFRVLNSDDIAKEMEKPGHALYRSLVDSFGEKILLRAESDRGGHESLINGIKNDNTEPELPINKEAFARLIYSDEQSLKKANSIIHPAVIKYINGCVKQSGNFVIETALPYPGFKEICDRIWFVHSPDDVRVKRLMKSRYYSRRKIISIIKNQMEDEQFKAIADEVLENSSDVDSLMRQTDDLMKSVFKL